MGTRLYDVFSRTRGDLRYEPTTKRVRAKLGEHVVADTTGALLVWEPRRVVPCYGIPADDLRAELRPSSAPVPEGDPDAPLLHTGFAFGVHSTPGEALDVVVDGETLAGAAFVPDDPDLAGHVVLDFHAFGWLEEEEPIMAHPRDPFHRVDILSSSRHVRIESGGELLAESSRPILVFETGLPIRYYIPPEDVVAELRPTDKRTYCAYKGEASYRALTVGGEERDDLVWGYEQPLRQAAEIAGRVAFYDEKVDVILDGRHRVTAQTALSRSVIEEAGD
ncbi:MAG: hypothetical protein QOJ35_2924 [Solirubrobacteraceae bacterium]|jgi:uncharacterized protein (DUF427 family)|nr:hypothetical protein [Solirubrobacteraceae bacterium]